MTPPSFHAPVEYVCKLVLESGEIMAAGSDDSYSEQILKDYKIAVIDCFNSHFDFLQSILQESTSKLAEKVYEAGLISEPATSIKNYDDLASEFTKGLKLKKTASEIHGHFKSFFEILNDIGGPATIAAEELGIQVSTLTGM